MVASLGHERHADFGGQLDEPAGGLHTSPPLIDQVYEALLGRISLGLLQPGQRVRQEALAAQFGVSRQPISHALQMLRRQGLVKDAGRQGVEISPINPEQIGQIYEVRSQLEGLAARLAAERVARGALTASDCAPLDAALARGQALAPGANSVAEFVKADAEFHKTLYALSGNPAIGEMLSAQWPHVMRAMVSVLQDPDRLARVWPEHAAIAASVTAGDAATAERLAADHTARAGREAELRLKRLAADALNR